MKKFLLIGFIFVLSFPLCACKKKINLNELSKNLTNYEITLNINTETKQVDAKQTITYVNNTNNILKNIKLHLYPQFFKSGATEKIVPHTKLNNAYPNGINYASFDISRVQVEDRDKTIVYENEHNSILSVELNNSLMPNENTKIFFQYSFTLPNCEHRFGFGDNTINIANFYPIVCVFENGKFNTTGYHSNGDPFYSDMSNYSVNIITDAQQIVAGSGNKINETIENNVKKTSFQAQMIRDFALIISNKFNSISSNLNGIKIEYFYIHDLNPNKTLQTGCDAIKTFSNIFGTYPYQTFNIVECDFVYGGMEYPNLIMVSNEIENYDDYLNVVIHETAHQWWYGIVGNNEFAYPWIDEALTEFSTIIFYDNIDGYAFNHEQMINISKENYTLFTNVYEDVLGTIDTSMRAVNEYSTEPEYTYCTYVKGVLMYESLYQLIGEKDFYEALKIYFEENKFKNVTQENLIHAFEKASEQNLENFFDSWIKGKVVIK